MTDTVKASPEERLALLDKFWRDAHELSREWNAIHCIPLTLDESKYKEIRAKLVSLIGQQ